MNHHIPVAVVGGGPCGMLTALLLGRHGVDVELFETKSGISTHPKAMGITRRTGEIFRQLGLEEELVGRSLPLEGKDLIAWSKGLLGESLGRTSLGELVSPFSPCQPRHCPQTAQEEVLWGALQKEARVRCRFGVSVESMRLLADGGELITTTGEKVTFDWLVAADGAGSRLRRQMEIPAHGPGDMGHFLNLYFRAPYGERLKGRGAVLYQCIWPERFEGFVAINGEDLWLMHHFLDPESRTKSFSSEELVELIRDSSGMPEVPVELISVHSWVMSPKLAQSFRKGRAFLVGDAAARLSPAGGLGLNTGMQSAHNLAWKLAWVVRGEAGESLLDSYDRERRLQSAHVMRHTNQNAGEIFAVMAEASRDNWEGVRSLIAHSRRGTESIGLDLGWNYLDETTSEAGLEKVNAYEPQASPGRRAPHVALRAEKSGGFSSLLDFFGREFVLVAGEAGRVWEQAEEFVCLRREGRDFVSVAGEAGSQLTEVYRFGGEEAVLVRPDGAVAARFQTAPSNPAEVVAKTLKEILAKL